MPGTLRYSKFLVREDIGSVSEPTIVLLNSSAKLPPEDLCLCT